MKYHVCTYKGETLVFSTAAKKEGADELFSAVATSPQEVVVKWLHSLGKVVREAEASQRAFGCWEVWYSLVGE